MSLDNECIHYHCINGKVRNRRWSEKDDLKDWEYWRDGLESQHLGIRLGATVSEASEVIWQRQSREDETCQRKSLAGLTVIFDSFNWSHSYINSWHQSKHCQQHLVIIVMSNITSLFNVDFSSFRYSSLLFFDSVLAITFDLSDLRAEGRGAFTGKHLFVTLQIIVDLL